ncbi:MAG TPA: hypothetical protein VHE83_19675 [Mycobacteriales bacterium]|nr:hypothetical protein [Mycobacteriales bacterium]
MEPIDGVVIRHLADLGADRVLWNASPPRVRPEPATLDVVHRCRADDDVVAAIARSVAGRITTVSRLREALAIRPRMHNRDLVREVLADVADGAESPLERRDLLNDRAHGLPSVRQVIRYTGKLKHRVDVIFEGDGLVAVVRKELDGALWHDGREGRFRDMKIDNAAEEVGDRTLRYGWEDEVGQPCEIAGQQIRVLQRNGWRGSGKRCGPSCTAFDQ